MPCIGVVSGPVNGQCVHVKSCKYDHIYGHDHGVSGYIRQSRHLSQKDRNKSPRCLASKEEQRPPLYISVSPAGPLRGCRYRWCLRLLPTSLNLLLCLVDDSTTLQSFEHAPRRPIHSAGAKVRRHSSGGSEGSAVAVCFPTFSEGSVDS